ncbi:MULTISPECIES: cytochrome c biogenesis protein CcsA [Reichenbachiella]|uniref:cytochrome c biogenesis protein CcsA n=1 Tax=Reichenbachiella TaxID=156993 RepID=UPI000E6C2EDA|nr:cytochrome c biogenesis protein CcsA [Reichenbachiella sp. MSK19-1]MBU2916063.1 cytochrome c biogenesis protein [Reichenbachiella agariperforans]RJE72121.1 ABC transporter permease [Reichenbachiella sp. MSK19-1]
MKKSWWKILGVLLTAYALLGGLLMEVPRLAILNETIRNLYYHVTMWFGMIILLTGSLVYSLRYLSSKNEYFDIRAEAYAKAGCLFGVLGIVTGMVWARYTWGEFWSGDPKQNASAIALLIYFAYFILRSSFEDAQQRSRISAVYNIFAYFAMIPLLFILPRLTDSMHPGNGGNPGFNYFDLDGKLRMIFYPAIVGWTLMGVWFASIKIRIQDIRLTQDL